MGCLNTCRSCSDCPEPSIRYKATLCRLCSHRPTLQHPGVHRAAGSCTAKPLSAPCISLVQLLREEEKKERKHSRSIDQRIFLHIQPSIHGPRAALHSSERSLCQITCSSAMALYYTGAQGRMGGPKSCWESPWVCGQMTHFPQPSFLLPQPAVQRGVCQTSSFICPFSFSIRHLPAFPNIIVPFFASQIVKITQTAKLAPCL